MNIGIFLSTMGGSPLQVGLERGLRRLGHVVDEYQRGKCYDFVIVFNQCAHTTEYEYPDFPESSQPILFVDSAEYGYFKRFPSVAGRYKNAFSEGSMEHDSKNRVQQTRLKEFLSGRSFPYFIREYFKFMDFPAEYHPIDYPLYEPSGCPHPPLREEYLRRTQDLFVSWGLSHPWRNQLTAVMRGCPLASEIHVIGESLMEIQGRTEVEAGYITVPRMPQGEYFKKTREAKCSVSFDGYGSSSFRLTEVLVRSLLIRGPLSIVRHEDLTDGVNCIEYDVSNEGEEFTGTNLGEKILESLADPDRCFRIHEAGYHHCMEHYTEKATAKYVLETIYRHDWSHPTSLDL